MKHLLSNKYIVVFCAGLLGVLGFAPFSFYPLAVLALAILFVQWQHARGKWMAARLGFAFGFGLFSAGIGWLYVALHDYGGMPMPLAAIAISLFAALLASFPAAVGYAQARLRARFGGREGVASNIVLLLLIPALWVLLEWLRGLLLTGFPWLSLGYTQAADSPLAGYAPLLGVYGVSLLVAVSAGLLALLWLMRPRKQIIHSKQGKIACAILVLLWLSGAMLRAVEWTQPEGEPLKVSLLQGNIAQGMKFDEDSLVGTLETYRRLAQSSDARLIVMPETALPLLREELPENYSDILRNQVRDKAGDMLIGLFERDRGLYYNSVVTLGSAEGQSYRKNHLVPFGEFIPLRPVLGWLINEILQIPMSDQARGGDRQQVLHVAGQRVAVDICYEDAFGEEIIRYLPEASLLVNVTNDAWYGKSHAAMQHNQLSQMRALETGRMMLRATNTGVTSIIGTDGRILQMLPQHEEGVLTGTVQGYTGSTPYVRWGNASMLGLIALMLAAAWRLRHSAAWQRTG
ncbi:MAG TPA: apolipoprotein N-acyltransferase [Gallionellaceae bacterium]|nr:apolipoprotein N-acyltransferase [Gallionellaceae bacterium]